MTPAQRLAVAERPERRFALALASPAVLVLVVTTTFPLLYLLWQSLQNINLAMPGMDRFVGSENYVRMWEDRRFWGALGFTVIYTGVTVALQLLNGYPPQIAIEYSRKVLFAENQPSFDAVEQATASSSRAAAAAAVAT